MKILIRGSLLYGLIGLMLGIAIAVTDYTGSRSRSVPAQVYEFPTYMGEEEKVTLINKGAGSDSDAYRLPEGEVPTGIAPRTDCWLSPLPWLFGKWCRPDRYHNGLSAILFLSLLGVLGYPLGLLLKQRFPGPHRRPPPQD